MINSGCTGTGDSFTPPWRLRSRLSVAATYTKAGRCTGSRTQHSWMRNSTRGVIPVEGISARLFCSVEVLLKLCGYCQVDWQVLTQDKKCNKFIIAMSVRKVA